MSDAPERIWIYEWVSNWSPLPSVVNNHAYIRADLHQAALDAANARADAAEQLVAKYEATTEVSGSPLAELPLFILIADDHDYDAMSQWVVGVFLTEEEAEAARENEESKPGVSGVAIHTWTMLMDTARILSAVKADAATQVNEVDVWNAAIREVIGVIKGQTTYCCGAEKQILTLLKPEVK